MKKLTLEQLIEIGRSAPKDGEFGLKEAKEEIKFLVEMSKRGGHERSLYEILGEYVERANTKDIVSNATMVYACWEVINDIS